MLKAFAPNCVHIMLNSTIHTKYFMFSILLSQCINKYISLFLSKKSPTEKYLGDLRLEDGKFQVNSLELDRFRPCVLADQEQGGQTKEGGPFLMMSAPREESHLCPLLRSALLLYDCAFTKKGEKSLCSPNKHENTLCDLMGA